MPTFFEAEKADGKSDDGSDSSVSTSSSGENRLSEPRDNVVVSKNGEDEDEEEEEDDPEIRNQVLTTCVQSHLYNCSNLFCSPTFL